MPRPGPRPYECVRRAWHSDRHKPTRGSIIQQIFRVVHERHSANTKKNKEWQEKLPIVVLKAEEIMYSKANSEAEYTDPETLWDRVNDAIDTIIRRDDSTETGQLLPPCVEAALNLGCIPIRASRSQRNSNPLSYLTPRTEATVAVHPKALDESGKEQNYNLFSLQSAKQSAAVAANPIPSTSECSRRAAMPSITNLSTSSCENLSPSSTNQIMLPESQTTLSLGAVYPLYYGTEFPTNVFCPSLQEAQFSNQVIVGKPVFPSHAQGSNMSHLENLFPCNSLGKVHDEMCQAASRNKQSKRPQMECDLSLRLGISLDSGPNMEKASNHCSPTNFPSDPLVSSDSRGLSSFRDKEFSFFPLESGKDSSGLLLNWRNSDLHDENMETILKKRKGPYISHIEDGRFSWQERGLQHSPGTIRRPGFIGGSYRKISGLPRS